MPKGLRRWQWLIKAIFDLKRKEKLTALKCRGQMVAELVIGLEDETPIQRGGDDRLNHGFLDRTLRHRHRTHH